MKTFCIWIVAGALLAFNGMAAQEEGFISLFNGKDLSGWDGDPKFWSVRDGAITGQTTSENPTKGNTFLIWRGGTVDDFELRFSYRLLGGNSGVQYRSRDLGNWVVGGYQADFEAGPRYSGILYEEGGRGILADRGQLTVIEGDPKNPKKHQVKVIGSLGKSEEIQQVIRPEKWNDYVVIARGNQLIHIINGRVTAVAIDDHQAARAKSGILALQLHAGPPMLLQMKDIRLKPL